MPTCGPPVWLASEQVARAGAPHSIRVALLTSVAAYPPLDSRRAAICRTDTRLSIVISFWMLATCRCGVFARANIELCRYCFGGSVFVNYEGCGSQLTSYHECRCPQRDADLDPPADPPRGDRSGDPAEG